MEIDVHELSVGGLLIDGGVLLLKGPIIITTKSLQIMNSGVIICDFLYFSTYNNCTTESPCVDLSLRADYVNLTSGGSINCSALSVNATSVYVEFNTSISVGDFLRVVGSSRAIRQMDYQADRMAA